MTYTQGEEQAKLYNNVDNGREYAIQVLFDESKWSPLWVSDLMSLKEARTDAVGRSVNSTCRIVKVSRYMSGGVILIHEIIQVYQQRKA